MVQTYVIYAALVIVGFILGFLVMRASSRRSLSQATDQSEMVRTQNTLASAAAGRQLELAKLQNTLASAAIDAHRGDYESARTTASSFFTSLRAEASKGEDSILSQAQKGGVEPLFARRDELISLLARNDPAAAERLSDLYVSFRELVSK
jgi:uncharacterized membrane-anchored protein YhcB (DUF1043 family)